MVPTPDPHPLVSGQHQSLNITPRRPGLPVSTWVAIAALAVTLMGSIGGSLITVSQTWAMFDARITTLERNAEAGREIAKELQKTREELAALRGAIDATRGNP